MGNNTFTNPLIRPAMYWWGELFGGGVTLKFPMDFLRFRSLIGNIRAPKRPTSSKAVYGLSVRPGLIG